MVAFEWHDPTRELVLNRGADPWFYVTFEGTEPSRRVWLRQAIKTPELDEYMQGIRSASNYVGQTFSLFRTAKARRPSKLLVPK